jgi:hypothetical protein
LSAIVAAGALLDGLLAVPVRRPRIFGDELIYWQLSRAFAWTGHFTVRGGSSPRYGYVYPALLAIAQRLGSDEHSAYAIAQGLNAILFSLAAIPTYAIAARVVRRRYALLAALLAVALPSCVYTSAIMTESAFYPLFLTTAWVMVRALERPSPLRQLVVAAAAAATFLVRAQAVVLLPSYLAAVLLLALFAERGDRGARVVAALRQHVPIIVVLVCAGVAAAALRGQSTLGPYHVLVSSYSVPSLVHWALANVADVELYLGVVPLAAFFVLLARSLSTAPLSVELRRVVVLTACLGAGLLATVAVLSASQYGLGRVHERNLFAVVPLVLIAFFAWLDAVVPSRRASVVVAAALAALPLAIAAPVIERSGEDGLALLAWSDLGLGAGTTRYVMVAAAAAAAALFLVTRRAPALVGLCVAAFAAILVAGEVHAVHSLRDNRAQWHDRSWIDHAVGADANVVALWATTHSGPEFTRIQGLWSDEFFNRSVYDVASADGPLPDGLPVEPLRIHANGCLEANFPKRPQYVVVESRRPVAALAVAVSPSQRATLYRLPPRFDASCFVHLVRPA